MTNPRVVDQAVLDQPAVVWTRLFFLARGGVDQAVLPSPRVGPGCPVYPRVGPGCPVYTTAGETRLPCVHPVLPEPSYTPWVHQ